MSLEGRRIQIRGTVQGVGFPALGLPARPREGIGGRVSQRLAGRDDRGLRRRRALEGFRRRTSDVASSRRRDPGDSRASRSRPSLGRIRHRRQPSGRRSAGLDPAGPRHVRRLPRRDLRSRQSAVPVRRSPTAPTADRASRSRARSPTTGRPPRWPPSRCARAAGPSTRTRGDRRFHAQPNACPACGPTLSRALSVGRARVLRRTRSAAPRGLSSADLIIAVKGLGGFHLACDATSSVAVDAAAPRASAATKSPSRSWSGTSRRPSRWRYSRAGSARCCSLAERPIVLVPSREGSGLAPGVAPDDNPLVGLLLPYTPLHHLLLADAGRPLVMTSGNLSEEPIVCGNDEAAGAARRHRRRLPGSRPARSSRRCDDSVARVIAGRPGAPAPVARLGPAGDPRARRRSRSRSWPAAGI